MSPHIRSSRCPSMFSTIYVVVLFQFLIESAPVGLRWSKAFAVVGMFTLSAIVFVVRMMRGRGAVNPSSLGFLLSVLCGHIIATLLNADYGADFLVFVLVVLAGFFTASVFELQEFLDGYLGATLIYSAYSLIATYIFEPLAMSGPLTGLFPVTVNSLGTPFMDMGMSFAVAWRGLMRNQGIFREPGVFQFFLLLAMAIELHRGERARSWLRTSLLAVTLLSTFSTAAMVALPLLFLSLLFRRDSSRRIKQVAVGGAIVAMAAWLSAPYVSASGQLERAFGKVGYAADTQSSVTRIESIANLMDLSFQRPIFGNSFTSGFLNIQENLSSYGTRDVTGTMFAFGMALGIPLGMWCLVNFFAACRSIATETVASLLVFACLFLSVNSQMLVYNAVLWVLLFSRYMKSARSCANAPLSSVPVSKSITLAMVPESPRTT